MNFGQGVNASMHNPYGYGGNAQQEWGGSPAESYIYLNDPLAANPTGPAEQPPAQDELIAWIQHLFKQELGGLQAEIAARDAQIQELANWCQQLESTINT